MNDEKLTPRMQTTGSPPGKLDGFDWKKILKGGGLAAAGFVGSWLLSELVPALQDTDDAVLLGLAALISVVANMLLKLSSDTRKTTVAAALVLVLLIPVGCSAQTVEADQVAALEQVAVTQNDLPARVVKAIAAAKQPRTVPIATEVAPPPKPKTYQWSYRKGSHAPVASFPATTSFSMSDAILIDVGQTVLLKADFELPPGHKIVSSEWRVGEMNGHFWPNGRAFCGTQLPGTYRVEYTASSARTFEVDVPADPNDPDGEKVRVEVAALPFVPHNYSWSVTIQGERPPPIDPDKPDPEQPSGPKSTAIIYPNLTAPPPAGAGAAETLQSEDKEIVFFVPAGVTTADGRTPAHLAPHLKAAQEVGLPAVVICFGDTVVKAEKMPPTRDQIVELVRSVNPAPVESN